jgi:hypothetical protein
MDQTSAIFWKMIFSVIGFGFFSYGKKQRALMPLLVGISLFAVPYFISNLPILIFTSLTLMIIPYFIKLPLD